LLGINCTHSVSEIVLYHDVPAEGLAKSIQLAPDSWFGNEDNCEEEVTISHDSFMGIPRHIGSVKNDEEKTRNCSAHPSVKN